jgi:hypothetical protein
MEAGRDDYDGLLKTRTIPEHEPRFILRAQDIVAVDTVRAWASLALMAGSPIAVVEQALQQADRMELWPVKKFADADHIKDPAVLELAFGQRLWSAEPQTASTVRELCEAKGFHRGYAAAERTAGRVVAQYRDRIEVLRAEAVAAERTIADLRAQLLNAGQALEEALAKPQEAAV